MALWSNTDAQASQPKSIRVGQITGLNVSGTMSGYVDGASLTISAPPAGGVQAAGIIKVTGGAITGFTITNPGAGYTTAPTVTAPAGTGATITASIKKNKTGNVVNSDIVFVSTEEAALTDNRIKGIKGPGWWKVTEKTQNDGTLRFISEHLVHLYATNATAGDAKGDDAVVGDVEISITTQPSAATVTAPAATSFTVVASGATTYQWQLQTGGVGAYADIANGGVYTTATTATLNISNSTGLSGNRYRCVVGNGGTAVAKSNGAKLTVN